MYGVGQSERRYGEALRGVPRDRYVLSTKVGRILRPDPADGGRIHWSFDFSAAAALQFILAHPAIASVIPGARSAAEVEDNIKMVEWPIPDGLWIELRHEGLIAAAAPTPASTG